MDFTNIFYIANIFFLGMSSDNETVDVASSDETESDNDNDGDDDTKDNEIINQASDDDKQKPVKCANGLFKSRVFRCDLLSERTPATTAWHKLMSEIFFSGNKES